MSTISGVGGGSTGWQNVNSSSSSRRERMFAKVDTNGDGSVDGAELQGMLDKGAQKSGGTAANADDVLKTLDSDGNGSLDASELDAGMKGLMPAPSSTVNFAQQRGEGRVHRGGDGPPPDVAAAGDSTTGLGGSDPSDGLSALLDKLFQAADTDGSGSLDKTELDTLKTSFDTAIQSLTSGTDGVASASDSAASGSTASGSAASGSAASGSAASSSTASGSAASGSAASSSTASGSAASGSAASSSTASGSSGSAGGNGTDSGTSAASSDPMMATLTALANLVLKEYAATAAASSSTQTTASQSISVTA